MAILHPWPKREPKIDERAVGISFVDVLFALVIGEVLEPLKDPDTITRAAAAQLVVAAVVTLTSWIGYHNSTNRTQFFIRFPNLPLLQFLLDIAMVVVYWLLAVGVEERTDVPDATYEAILVAVAFLLYVGWDRVALQIRRNDLYVGRPPWRDVPARRDVTLWFCGISVVTAVLVMLIDPESSEAVMAVDAWLIALAVGFRLRKEYVTIKDPFGQSEAPEAASADASDPQQT